MARDKPTFQEPVAHPAASRVRMMEDLRASHSLPERLFSLLRAVNEGSRGAALGEAVRPDSLLSLEAEFEALVGESVYVTVAKIAFAAATGGRPALKASPIAPVPHSDPEQRQ